MDLAGLILERGRDEETEVKGMMKKGKGVAVEDGITTGDVDGG